MNTMILQQFLDLGLLDVGDDNTKFSYLEKSSDDITKNLKKDKRAVARCVSLVLNERLIQNEPLVIQCQEALKKHWPTYLSRFRDNTDQLFRAILLQAIAKISGDEDISISAIVYYTGINLVPYLVTGKEDDVFRTFFIDLGEKVEAQATSLWAKPGQISDHPPEYSEPDIAISSQDVQWLTDKLKAAAGPSGENANSEWPGANSPTWLEHFGKAAAQAIAGVIVSSLKASAPSFIAKSREDINIAIEPIVNALGQAGSMESLRTDLLYWKETLYSLSQKASYRGMSPDVAAFWMAHDLHYQIPSIHPHSVEYFLRETLRTAFGDEAQQTRSIGEFCSDLQEVVTSASVYDAPTIGERISLLEFIQGLAGHQLQAEDLLGLTGISSETTITRTDLSAWLFRDFQVARLVGGKYERVRKAV